MGRHRRATPAPVAPPEPSHRQDAVPHRGGGHAGHRKRSATPVRTGLIGASAAMAMGAVAVASGLIPGPGGLGGHQSGDRVRADGPTGLDSPAVPSVTPSARASDSAASRAEERNDGPTRSPSRESSRSSKKPGDKPSREQASETPEKKKQSDEPSRSGSGSGSGRESGPDREGGAGGATKSADPETAAEQEVLTLVNQERAKAGCQPVKANSDLAGLAQDFSEDMAGRGFFSHTDPDGRSPWDRAEAAGVSGLGGENIARGQANARSVMDSWMNSPGHKANILNCDYRTLGVGAHFAEGGPWWTQDFGF
ncbi:CAP domain-containing protein [Streptomyces sp. NBC_01187]|uniref:CAP domain-containing protein n=1 Tax=Streptomyces sp. NBC_01187 TaxID=2903766 RepID=UPI003866FA73|nr:CAP domain-containing protein [Streptomyces sp. NBC_01187]